MTFDIGINIEHMQIPKQNLTEDENCHDTQYFKKFFVFACADIQFLKIGLKKVLNFAKMVIYQF